MSDGEVNEPRRRSRRSSSSDLAILPDVKDLREKESVVAEAISIALEIFNQSSNGCT
jgi:hypothetical protein